MRGARGSSNTDTKRNSFGAARNPEDVQKHTTTKCYNCESIYHWANDCPDKYRRRYRNEEEVHFQDESSI